MWQGAFSHAFISEFDNEEDRRYYLKEDPAHLDFMRRAGEVVENVRVVDFVDGVI